MTRANVSPARRCAQLCLLAILAFLVPGCGHHNVKKETESDLQQINRLLIEERYEEAGHLAERLVNNPAAPRPPDKKYFAARDALIEAHWRAFGSTKFSNEKDAEKAYSDLLGEATKAIQERPSDDPTIPRALFNRGCVYHLAGLKRAPKQELLLAIQRLTERESQEPLMEAICRAAYATLVTKEDIPQSDIEDHFKIALLLLDRLLPSDPVAQRARSKTLSGYANLLIDFHQFERAEQLLHSAIEIEDELSQRLGMPASTEAGFAHSRLADAYKDAGRYDEAVQEYLRAEAILKARGRSLEATRAEMNLGLCHAAGGDPSKALSIYDSVRRDFGEEADPSDLAAVQNNEGDSLIALGRPEDAVSILIDGLKNQEQSDKDEAEEEEKDPDELDFAQIEDVPPVVNTQPETGDRKPIESPQISSRGVIESLRSRALALARSNKPREAFTLAEDAEKRAREFFRATIRDANVTERNALRLDQHELSSMDLLVSLAAATQAPEMVRSAFDQWTQSRAIVLDEITRRLTRSHQPTGEGGLAEVLRQLPADAAMVSYVLYKDLLHPAPADRPSVTHESTDGVWIYGAFVVTRQHSAPVFVPLGPQADVDSAVLSWRDAFKQNVPSLSDYTSRGGTLRHLIWDRIETRLKSPGLVFVVPDRAIHLVSFLTLPVGPDEYLLDRSWAFHYLSTERDFLASRQRNPTHGALVVSGPDYGSIPRRKPDPTHQCGGDDPRCSVERQRGTSPPPWTCIEGAEEQGHKIAEILRPLVNSLPIQELTGPAATEAAFRKLAPRTRIIHVLTHGVFDQESPEENLNESESRSIEWRADRALGGSQLVFAGANCEWWKNPNYHDDGLMTARELAKVDMSDVEWLVLAACDTGVGEPIRSEGVFGLRRGCYLARAGSVIMSLWEVDAKATNQWMETLYRKRAESKGGELTATWQAVNEATLSLRKSQKALGRSHPYWWGAFVAAGDYH